MYAVTVGSWYTGECFRKDSIAERAASGWGCVETPGQRRIRDLDEGLAAPYKSEGDVSVGARVSRGLPRALQLLEGQPRLDGAGFAQSAESPRRLFTLADFLQAALNLYIYGSQAHNTYMDRAHNTDDTHMLH